MFLFKKAFQNKRIKRITKELEPEDVFWDAFTQKKEGEVFRKKMEVALSGKMAKLLWFVFLILAATVLIKTFQFQILDHKKYSDLATKNQFMVSSLTAERGIIYDKNLEQLVFNKQDFNLTFDKEYKYKNSGDKDKAFRIVSWILGLSQEEIKNKIASNQQKKVLLVNRLDYQKLILLKSNNDILKGFSVNNNSCREYKDGEIFAHIIGYHRSQGENMGLEKFYNKELESVPGKLKTQRDVYGNIVSEQTMSPPKSGDSLVLSLDANLQEKLFKTMAEEMKKAKVKRGSAVAMDPKTGEILALVSFPSFDNNLFSQNISQEQWSKLLDDKNKPFLNRVIAGRYPVGSTIKPLIGAGALQEKVVSASTIINCKGKIVVDNPWFPDKPFVFNDWKTHGKTDIRKAIAESCNVFFYTVGGGYKDFKGLGIDRIKKYLGLFGWEEKLGIDLPGEIKGFVPDKEWKKKTFSSPNSLWMPGDTYNLSIGQGFIGITPLEVVTSFAAIANGGKLFQPHIVKEIIDQNKNLVKEIAPKIIREGFIDPNNLQVIREGMRGTVAYGSATLLNDLPVSSAAKTGTAEIGKKGRYHSWITVFAPYKDPQIVLTVMIEDGLGMHVAVAPTANKVLDWYFKGEKSATSTNPNK